MSRTYVIPDLHGRFDLLQEALARIEASPSGGTVVFLGDYVDRGPDSHGVINHLMAGAPSGWRWVCLRGNHEDMMREVVRGSAEVGWWVGNGGGATLASYGGEIDPAHLDWIEKLPLYHADQHRIYVHAGVDPTIAMEDQTEAMLLWSRLGKHVDCVHLEGYVVHGHTPFEDGPIILDGRANLDTGAVWTGTLCVAVFDDDVSGKPIEVWLVKSAPELAGEQ